MIAATYRKQGMLAHLRMHVKESLYNRTGMKDSIPMHTLIEPVMDIFAIRLDAVMSRPSSELPANHPIINLLYYCISDVQKFWWILLARQGCYCESMN
jgi:hypothetical protein